MCAALPVRMEPEIDLLRLHLRRWRECLLDQSARNPLLKLEESRVSRLRVKAPDLEPLFRLLAPGRKVRLPFAQRAGGEIAFAEDAAEVERKLRRIRDNARTSLEERGVTTLHVTLGALHFSDARLGGECAAPLWLVPCRLESHGPDRPLTLEHADEDAALNPVLEVFLRERHKLRLPAMPDDPCVETFRAVLDAISDGSADRGWRVEPDAFLSTFSFESLVLWRDLEALEEEAIGHPVVRAFARAGVARKDLEPMPRDLDTLRVPVPILETDSSQLEALALAAHGHDLVVHGPPGTGKSQTIANLIADALGRGKTVLFVSAKMAALEVVHRRLVEHGLGDYCLEAHSARAGKTRILGELRRVLENATRGPESTLEAKLDDLHGMRDRLNAYVRALHARRGEMDRSAYEAIGDAERTRHAPEARFALPWADPLAVSRAELTETLDAIDELASYADVHDTREANPWRGLAAGLDDGNLEKHLETAAELAGRLAGVPLSFDAASRIVRALERRDDTAAELRLRIDGPPAEAAALLRPARDRWTGWDRFLDRDHARWRRAVRARSMPGAACDRESLCTALALAERVVELDARLAGLPSFPREAVAALSPSIEGLRRWFPEGLADGMQAGALDFARLAARCEELLAARSRLDSFRRMTAARERCLSLGLAPLLGFSRSIRHARSVFERRFHFAWVHAAIRSDATLASFDGERQETLIERFREIDGAARRAALRRVIERVSAGAVAVREAAPDAGRARQISTLRRELVKRRSARPLRKLFGDAPDALQALKPCMLMSPISISTYLPAGAIGFDLVVFDEASQVPTPQAIPAIVRAKQCVVAGDPKQMPPSSFFEAQRDGGDDSDAHAEIEPLESLLDECVASVPAFREAHLRWHYRSHDERLIQFSNHQFYEDRLITFPSTAVWASSRGVRLVHVADGIWDRGRTRRNPIEARRVAEAVGQLFQEDPERSVGVIAMNGGQREAIEDALAALGIVTPESLFVKSLENVQGDERDVIVLSLGYARDANGALAMHFGPLNADGGWRRLNVLVTRAKRETVVVSSLTAADLSGVNESNRGAVALRDYLAYAEEGAAPAARAAAEMEPDPFTEAIRAALEERGYKVDLQVGIGGCRIDLGVRHPDDDSRYVLGIECDGPGFAGARTARDRDVLRRAALEAKGWRLHRVWSPDWFRDRERTLERLLRAIARARGPISFGRTAAAPALQSIRRA